MIDKSWRAALKSPVPQAASADAGTERATKAMPGHRPLRGGSQAPDARQAVADLYREIGGPDIAFARSEIEDDLR